MTKRKSKSTKITVKASRRKGSRQEILHRPCDRRQPYPDRPWL